MSMPDPTSVQSILDAAEQAAAIGDIGIAGQLLRRAVALQETQLGPHHPDLANTLNNLGVVWEKTGRLDDAEGCYRRAYEIAAAALEPDHPFVITSRKNLADFREARGTAVEPPPASAALPPASAAVPAGSPPQRPAPATIEQDTAKNAGPSAKQAGFRRARSGPLMIVLAALVVLVLGVVAIRRTSGPVEPSSSDSSPAAPAPTGSLTDSSPASGSAAPVIADPSGPSKNTPAPSPPREERSPPEARFGSTRAPAQPTVAEAQVCRRFSTAGSGDWRCESSGPSVAPGSLVYYTRIKTAGVTTVEHRWYHGDDLKQKVRLRIAANADAGFRTYSRLAVSAGGQWRVELRTADGTVLHEVRFNVR